MPKRQIINVSWEKIEMQLIKIKMRKMDFWDKIKDVYSDVGLKYAIKEGSIKMDSLEKIAAILGCRPSELLEDEEISNIQENTTTSEEESEYGIENTREERMQQKIDQAQKEKQGRQTGKLEKLNEVLNSEFSSVEAGTIFMLGVSHQNSLLDEENIDALLKTVNKRVKLMLLEVFATRSIYKEMAEGTTGN